MDIPLVLLDQLSPLDSLTSCKMKRNETYISVFLIYVECKIP